MPSDAPATDSAERDATTAVAAIDCGTNSTRLLVADATGVPLERLMRITRLGQGVDATGRLAPEAIDRCVAVLVEYRSVMDRLGVGRGRLAATSAARDAANGADFLAAAGEATGLRPELLTGVDEGRLSLAGAVADLDPAEGPFLVLDIGGGSTELVAGDGPHDPGLAAVSLQLGCVRVSERFLGTDPPTAAELAAARSEVDAQLERAVADHPRFASSHRLVGLAGTVSTLVSLHLGMATYDRDLVHHAVLTADDVRRWYEELAADTAADRLARPGMVPGRQDVIVGGALILDAVMERLGFTECLVSESDILDGLVASQLT
jgi:exopolyphosphatase/guanosine-5'-triphosphate,3'-diphosphate pyrophosphatase